MTLNSISRALSAVLFLLLIGVAHAADEPQDKRISVKLTSDEREFVLAEMRHFLVAIKTITDALSRDDMATVASAASAMGMKAAHGMPPQLQAKLPLEFKKFARSVHAGFDTLALDAQTLGDAKHSLSQVSTVLESCASCHATYQIPSQPVTGRGQNRNAVRKSSN